jgi:hypothetical protein
MMVMQNREKPLWFRPFYRLNWLLYRAGKYGDHVTICYPAGGQAGGHPPVNSALALPAGASRVGR